MLTTVNPDDLTAYLVGSGPDRSSTPEWIADTLRTAITDGRCRPGSRLREEHIAGALNVSRNSVREAFRLLVHERLLVYELNKGVFVRTLSAADVVDLYRIRRLLEGGAIRAASADALGAALPRAAAALAEAEAAAARDDWSAVGTANMHFHQAVAALAGSRRVDETMRLVLAELRLVFHVMARHRRFHEPYLGGNRELYTLLAASDLDVAERRLSEYLDAAERQLVDAFAAVVP
ncbi:MAG: GntR family transcriptional regulator [Actinobacteria bacterium 13_2_20CM_2_71_6]|nr:MAG: GntR family transcriptional regulator [Actinobacteria bacterium 13_2_20CM_2_71_6]